MADEQVTIVQRMFSAFRESGNIDDALAFFDPAVQWIDDVVTHSALHGHDGFREVMRNLEREGYVVEADPDGFDEIADGVVLARGYTRLVRGKTYTDLPAFWTFEVRDGKIVRGGSSTRRREALKAVGLTE